MRTPPLVALKGHGTENDFVLVPDLQGLLELTPEVVAALCDRRAGIGGDGLLRVVPTAAVPEVAHLADDLGGGARWFMDYRNADGSVAEMCGNGLRVFGRYLVDSGVLRPGDHRIATRGGVKLVSVPPQGDVTVEMGAPTLPDLAPSVTLPGHVDLPATAVMMPNPHAVTWLPEGTDLASLDLTAAPTVTPADGFPDGVNVELVLRTGPRALSMRVHERGVGETRSCGTGVCAVVVAAVLRFDEGRGEVWTVQVPGGLLSVAWTAETVLMTGPAVLVAEIAVRGEWVTAAAQLG